MPAASGKGGKYFYQDHDTADVTMTPPVQNTWYEIFHDYNVRLIWCVILQNNDEFAAKTLQVRWTIDGNVYLAQRSCSDLSECYVFRLYELSGGGTGGLTIYEDELRNAAYNVDKRGQDFKVEVRITDVVGTNQVLRGSCVYETLEETPY